MAIIPKGLLGSDFDDPKTRGILGLAQGLLAAGGYQDRPTTLGQVLAAGAGAGMTAYEQAKERQRLEADAAEKKKLQDLQMQQTQQSIDATAAAATAKEAQSMAQKRISTLQQMKADPAGAAFVQGIDVDAEINRLLPAAYPDVAADLMKSKLITKDPEYGFQKVGPVLHQTVDGKLGDPVATLPPKTSLETLYNPDKNINELVLINEDTGDILKTLGPAKPETSKIDLVTLRNPETQELISLDANDPKLLDFTAEGYVEVSPSQITGTAEEVLGLTTTSMNALQQKIINNTDFIEEAIDLKRAYDSKFLTVPGKLEFRLLTLKERFGGDIDPAQKEYLENYTEFATNAYNMVNNYIKSITGAAMSVQEAKRILRAIPDIDSMSPTQFEAALNTVMEKAQLAKARAILMAEEGLLPERTKDDKDVMFDYSLSQVDKKLQDKANALSIRYQEDGMSEDDANKKAYSEIHAKYQINMNALY